MAKIELHILNPEQFDTLQKIRDFVTGRGAEVLHHAIGEACGWVRQGIIEQLGGANA